MAEDGGRLSVAEMRRLLASLERVEAEFPGVTLVVLAVPTEVPDGDDRRVGMLTNASLAQAAVVVRLWAAAQERVAGLAAEGRPSRWVQ